MESSKGHHLFEIEICTTQILEMLKSFLHLNKIKRHGCLELSRSVIIAPPHSPAGLHSHLH